MDVPDKENMEYRQAQGLKIENSETYSKQDIQWRRKSLICS